MTTELQEFIEICDCKEIQEKCIDTSTWVCSFCGLLSNDIIVHTCNGHTIKLPTIDQLLEMLGDRFESLTKYIPSWECCIWDEKTDQFSTPNRIEGQSARIALAKAVKEISKEKEIKNGK